MIGDVILTVFLKFEASRVVLEGYSTMLDLLPCQSSNKDRTLISLGFMSIWCNMLQVLDVQNSDVKCGVHT